jgi:prepilin-type processing-associated H-X9-DG protein
MDTLPVQLTRYLWDQSWQIAVLTVLVAGASFLLRRRSAHLRHLLWLVVLAKCLVPPLVSVSVPLLPATAATTVVPGTFAEAPGLPMVSEPMAMGQEGPEPLSAPADAPPPQAPSLRRALAALGLHAWLALAWVFGAVAVLSMVAVKAARTFWWLRRDRRMPPAALGTSIAACLQSLGVRHPPRVWLIRHAGQPFVWGLLRGDIYLPARVGRADDRQRRHLLAHEVSHVLRCDAAVNLLQILAQALYWFHPLVWWANRRIRMEREKSCDEMALARLQTKPRDYGRAIVEVLLAEQESRRRIPTLAIAGPVKNIEERIRTMLQPGKQFYRHPSVPAAACALLLAVLIVPTTLALTRPAGPADTPAQTATADEAGTPDTSPRTLSADNLKQLGLGLILYAMDHEKKYPDEVMTVMPYLKSPHAEQLEAFLLNDVEYLGAGKKCPEGDTSGVPLAYDLTLLRAGAGTNVLFADAHVELVGKDRLQEYGIELPQSKIEIQEVRFEPIRQGKNVVYVTARNTSEKEQVLAIHIYTRSPDYGPEGVGWGTPFFATFAPHETRPARFVFKIQGPVTDRTYVNLRFYNPETQDTYAHKRYFERRQYKSEELPKAPPSPAAHQPASPAETQAVTQAFQQIQGYIQNRQYQQAWERFSKDFRDAEYQKTGFEAFRRAMEPENPMHSAFTWEREDFLKLKPEQVLKNGDVLTLAAALDGQTWLIDFVQQDGQWKIDWIAGYTPGILKMQEQEEPAPTPQAKNNPARESTLQVLDVRFEPLRQGKNAVQIQVQNPRPQARILAVSIQARNPGQGGRFSGWGTTLFETLKPGATQWTHFGFKIYGPPADSTGIELRFFDPGPVQGFDREKWIARKPWDEWFRQIDYSGRDLPRSQPDAAAWQPAPPGETQAAAAALRQLQKHLDNRDYGRAWQLFSDEFRDAEFFDRFEYLQDRMEKPRTVAFPVSRSELLALEPGSAQAHNGVLALAATGNNKSWTIRFVNAQGQWVVDSIDPVPRATDVASLQAQQEAVMQAFTKFQNCLREKRYEAAWELVTGEIRSQYDDDVKKWRETLESNASLRTVVAGLRPESVTPNGELLTLTARYENQTWKLHFLDEDGRWKLYVAQIQRGDWQENLLPTLPKRVTEHFDIYYFKGSTAEKEIDQIARRKDEGFAEICRFLGKDSDTRIRLVLFEDGQTKQLQTGHQGAGWAFGNTIVEVYNEKEKLDPYHETAHILMGPVGHPPALFNEGFATYMSERLGAHALESLGGGQATLHQRAGELKAKGDWIELGTLLSFTEIGSAATRPPVAYAEAGSFVKFLIEEYGKDKFLQAYGTLQNSDTSTVRQENLRKLAEIYGRSPESLEERWLKTIAIPAGPKAPAGTSSDRSANVDGRAADPAPTPVLTTSRARPAARMTNASLPLVRPAAQVVPAPAGEPPGRPRRVVHFPADRPVGQLRIQDEGGTRKLTYWFHWTGIEGPPLEYLCEAQGDVEVPPGKRLYLLVNAGSWRDLSWFSRLRPDDLYSLSFTSTRDGPRPDDGCMPPVAHLTGLRHLAMEGTRITDRGMKYLAGLTALEELSLSPRVTDAGLASLAGLSSLKRLYFPQTGAVTSAGLRHLSKLTALEELYLGERIGDAGLAHLRGLPHLHYLCLYGAGFTDAGLVYVKEIPSLRVFSVHENLSRITDAGLVHIAQLPNLEILCLHGMKNITDAGIVHLAGLRSLKKLDIGSSQITDKGLASLKQLKTLERLNLPQDQHGITDAGLAHLAELSNLRHLEISRIHFAIPGMNKEYYTDRGLADLARLSQLEDLHLGSIGVTDAGMDHVAKLTNLKWLHLFGCEQVTDRGLAKLAALKSLENLDVSESQLTVGGLAALNSLPNLKRLWVHDLGRAGVLNLSGLTRLETLGLFFPPRTPNTFGDADLAGLAGLKNLRDLQIGPREFTDQGLAQLAGLTNMERILVSGSGLTDEGLKHLANMKKLYSLSIEGIWSENTGDWTAGGQITDEGLRHLEGLKRLIILEIRTGKMIAPAAIQRLRRQLPNLYVLNVIGPTSDRGAVRPARPAPTPRRRTTPLR